MSYENPVQIAKRPMMPVTARTANLGVAQTGVRGQLLL